MSSGLSWELSGLLSGTQKATSWPGCHLSLGGFVCICARDTTHWCIHDSQSDPQTIPNLLQQNCLFQGCSTTTTKKTLLFSCFHVLGLIFNRFDFFRGYTWVMFCLWSPHKKTQHYPKTILQRLRILQASFMCACIFLRFKLNYCSRCSNSVFFQENLTHGSSAHSAAQPGAATRMRSSDAQAPLAMLDDTGAAPKVTAVVNGGTMHWIRCKTICELS